MDETKQIVQAKYPDAVVVNFGERRGFAIYIVHVDGVYRIKLGTGSTENEAWLSAAKSINGSFGGCE